MSIDDNVILLSDVSPDVWSSVLDSLQNSLSPSVFGMWFDKGNLSFDRVEDGKALLVAANGLVKSWIGKHFRSDILRAFQKVLPEVSDFEISVSDKSVASPVPIISSDAVVRDAPAPRPSQISRVEKLRIAENAETLASFYPSYSFDSFVEGESNRIALEMCRSIAENPSDCSMNPFFLYGGPGVGKTHLLQSIGRYAITYSTAERVVFRTAERFLKDFMKTQKATSREDRADAVSALRHTYEEPSLLLIDDIQVLAGMGRGATEKALFDVLQKRSVGKKPTVFCADRRPSEIPNLYEGFTRFDCNSIAVNIPDLLTRVKILRKKAAALQIPADERERIFDWVARHQRGNVREIEGVVTKLFAYHDLLGVNLTLETFKDLCRSCEAPAESESPEKPVLTIESIKELVAFAYKVPVESLRASSRVKSISVPRKVAMYFCRMLTKETDKNIGYHFGRDYSTVIANISAVKREMRQNAEFAAEIEKIRESFAS